MPLSVFDDPGAAPTERALAQALGPSAKVWTSLIGRLSNECAPLEPVWAFAGAKFGWSLRLKRGTRVIVYMTPGKGQFLASFVFGEKACAAARDVRLPAAIVKLIADAPRYAEGRGFRITVRTEKQAASIRTLAAIKIAH